MNIEKFSHHFAVFGFNQDEKKAILEFVVRFAEVSFDRWGNKVIARTYAASTKSRKEFRFHINSFDSFKIHLQERGIQIKDDSVVQYPLYEPVKVVYGDVQDPREYQIPIINFNILTLPRSKLVELQTGKGKTYIALASVAKTNERFVLATKGGFVSRWLKDVCGDESVLKLAHNDVIVVKGTEALKVIIQLALTDQLEFTGLLISTNTLNNYYKHYFDNDGDMEEYGGLHPVALWALLKVGTLITDEFHMLLHMNYVREMYNHVPKTIALSATMIPTGPFMKMIHDTLFPKECRAPAVEYDKYIAVKALFYGIHPETKDIKCFRNSKYNHTMYEEQIMKRKKVLKNYLEMLTTITRNIFVGEGKRLPGEKMIVYVSTQDMATQLTDYFKEQWGDQFKIKRFVSMDPYSNVEEAELIVSTPGSLGTAHDVANLRFTLLTTALGKEDTNVQLLGRLRRLKNNPDVTPEMYYLVNRDIKKHMDYHMRKRELFKPITLSQVEFETPFKV